MFYELQLGGDVFELGQADGVRFMGGQCLRLLVGDLSCGSVGTKVVERKVLKPASTLSPPLFCEVSAWLGLSLGFLVRPDPLGSVEIMWLVLSRGCVWGASSLSVVARAWRFSWQCVSSSRDCIRISFGVSVRSIDISKPG
ncbi:hypothetical protein F2Q69_00050530 [Brassica cretica]|uniref:Uncharacterized protein n=1 Tax=Brassica cretica TaxID=69181 RepID=A0A8S9PPZ4_BRACR|nr:hypothetical protein F2Q69_00050530 [Brassica cretica]